ncbi:hypothetical protein Pse7367_1340 [Thalassoporum mexicanum PCC 7367]|uniref:hypothetical protein n=1 Tax=Thalassoporum mexicanum TaxID=3457544 RepID=UPI00029F94B8|nr:hypothetical protein [Pseudanabaena sp. PCC 7367]AFY69632.1 hypothetical protein Pse7367_1340 [Pseudanabaena sp. PCC 7367]
MLCKKKLAKVIRAHRDFHLFSGLFLDKGVRKLGVHKCLLTKPLYKFVKVAGYTNVALASIALVVVDD